MPYFVKLYKNTDAASGEVSEARISVHLILPVDKILVIEQHLKNFAWACTPTGISVTTAAGKVHSTVCTV